ncbi:hypothetical protein C8A05DRAFT_38424, partial [Staphylotrichum tortipilum]
LPRRDPHRHGPALPHLHNHHLRRPRAGLHPWRAVPRVHALRQRGLTHLFLHGERDSLGHGNHHHDGYSHRDEHGGSDRFVRACFIIGAAFLFYFFLFVDFVAVVVGAGDVVEYGAAWHEDDDGDDGYRDEYAVSADDGATFAGGDGGGGEDGGGDGVGRGGGCWGGGRLV